MAILSTPTEAEKIDEIYKYIRGQKIKSRIKTVCIILFLGLMYYGIRYLSLPENAQTKATIGTEFKSQVMNAALPIAQDLSLSLIQSMAGGSGVVGTEVQTVRSTNVPAGNIEAQSIPEITPEMIEAVRKTMGK